MMKSWALDRQLTFFHILKVHDHMRFFYYVFLDSNDHVEMLLPKGFSLYIFSYLFIQILLVHTNVCLSSIYGF